MALTVMALTVIIGTFLILFFVKRASLSGSDYGRNRKMILKSGVTALAKVLSIQKTGRYSKGGSNSYSPEVKIILEIQPSETQPYVVETMLSMHDENIYKYATGTLVTVFLDPNDRNNFLIRGLEYN